MNDANSLHLTKGELDRISAGIGFAAGMDAVMMVLGCAIVMDGVSPSVKAFVAGFNEGYSASKDKAVQMYVDSLTGDEKNFSVTAE